MLSYSSPNLQRRITFNLLLLGEDKAICLAYLTNTKRNKRFNLETYLIKHNELNESESDDPFKFESYQGTFKEKAQQFSNFINKVIHSHRNLFEGKEWEEVVFD